MGLALEHSYILHIPKTGGTHVRALLDVNDIKYKRSDFGIECTGAQQLINKKRCSHCIPYDDVNYRNRKNRLVFLRHPLTWYQSYWAFRVMHTQPGGDPILAWRIDPNHDGSGPCILDVKAHSNDFKTFIDNVIANFPHGCLSEAFQVYIDECNHIGRMESLEADLEGFLLLYENKKLENTISIINKGNAEFKAQARYTRNQATKILEIEKDIITGYGYTYIPDNCIEEV
jgi:hypothetical protein